MATFRDREDAGAQLAAALSEHASDPDVVVLALPRGGVPVGYEIATRLGVPLDVLVVRKLGVPGHEELAMGAIASGDAEVIDPRITAALGITRDVIDRVAAHERIELARRERLFRGDRPPLDVRGKTAIVVDDGLATGSTMSVAIDATRGRGAARVACAVPVGPPEACEAMARRADEAICLESPEWLYAVGQAYDDFTQVSDEEVRALLDRAPRKSWRSKSTSRSVASS
jgi:predicted phosphoribosyltransferase